MNYIMERFDQVISSLSDNNRNNCIPKKEDTDSIIKDFALEKERIRLHIMEEVFNVHEENLLYFGNADPFRDDLGSGVFPIIN